MDFFERAMSGARANLDAQVEFCRLVSAPVGRLWVDSGREGVPTPGWLVEHNDLGGMLQRAVLFEWAGFMRNAPIRFIELTLHKHLCRMQAGLPNRCIAYHTFVFATLLASSDSGLDFVRRRLAHEGAPGRVEFFSQAWFPTVSAVLHKIWWGEFNEANAGAIVTSQAGFMAGSWLEGDRGACTRFLAQINRKVERLILEASMTQEFKQAQKQFKTTARNEREKKTWTRFYDGDVDFPRQAFTNVLRDQLKTHKLIRNGGRRTPANATVPPTERNVRNMLDECARYAAEIGIDPADVDQPGQPEALHA